MTAFALALLAALSPPRPAPDDFDRAVRAANDRIADLAAAPLRLLERLRFLR